MDMRGYQRYREDSLSTMTQGELLLLLFDELVKRLTQAELELEREHYPAFEAAVDRSVKIIRYLDDTLDRQYPIRLNSLPLNRKVWSSGSSSAGSGPPTE